MDLVLEDEVKTMLSVNDVREVESTLIMSLWMCDLMLVPH